MEHKDDMSISVKEDFTLIRELESMPAKLKAKQLELLESKTSLDEIEKEIKRLENKHVSSILDEMEASGKIKFSNQQKRDVELLERLTNDAAYQLQKKSLKEMQKQEGIRKIDVEFLRNRMNVLMAILPFVGEKIV